MRNTMKKMSSRKKSDLVNSPSCEEDTSHMHDTVFMHTTCMQWKLSDTLGTEERYVSVRCYDLNVYKLTGHNWCLGQRSIIKVFAGFPDYRHGMYKCQVSVTTSASTFRGMTRSRAEMKRRRHCLMNQVDQRTHCCRPIINIDSLIRVSFSNTSSWDRKAHAYMYVQCTCTVVIKPVQLNSDFLSLLRYCITKKFCMTQLWQIVQAVIVLYQTVNLLYIRTCDYTVTTTCS